MGACFIFQLSADYSLPYRFSPLFFLKKLANARSAMNEKAVGPLGPKSLHPS